MIQSIYPQNSLTLPSEYECPICLKSEETTPWVWTSCNPVRHIFHQGCLIALINQKPLNQRQCAICRQDTVTPMFNQNKQIQKLGLHVNWPNQLMDAVKNNDVKGLEKLLQIGASPDLDGFRWCHPDSTGVNSYFWQEIGNKIVKFTPPPIFVASDSNHPEIVKILIKYGASVNIPLNPIDPIEPVSFATQKGLYDIVKILIDNHANVNSDSNYNGLMIAIDSKNSKISQLLIDSGASLSSKEKNGKTVFQCLAFSKFYDLMIHILTKPKLKKQLTLNDICSGIGIILHFSQPSTYRDEILEEYFSCLNNEETNLTLNQTIYNTTLLKIAEDQQDKKTQLFIQQKLKKSPAETGTTIRNRNGKKASTTRP